MSTSLQLLAYWELVDSYLCRNGVSLNCGIVWDISSTLLLLWFCFTGCVTVGVRGPNMRDWSRTLRVYSGYGMFFTVGCGWRVYCWGVVLCRGTLLVYVLMYLDLNYSKTLPELASSCCLFFHDFCLLLSKKDYIVLGRLAKTDMPTITALVNLSNYRVFWVMKFVKGVTLLTKTLPSQSAVDDKSGWRKSGYRQLFVNLENNVYRGESSGIASFIYMKVTNASRAG